MPPLLIAHGDKQRLSNKEGKSDGSLRSIH